MAYRNKTYVIFDGDNDMWAYAYMKGWKSNENVDFNFHDAHDLKPLTDRASDETIYRRLRERFSNAKQVIVIIGEHTKHLHKFVRWEIEIALDLGLPIIAVNLNGARGMDSDRCPPILRDEYVVHVPFKAAIVQYALDRFPSEHANRSDGQGPRHYPTTVYQNLGL
ncbi:MAG TPA: TIR domain-containing protein [Bryobacteraceae bacterium]|nr:TIR domain-containing protein [Bryobacteraceae bacterium]